MNFFDTSNPHLYVAITLVFINATLLCFAAYSFFQAFQLEGYRLTNFFKWLKKYGKNIYVRLLIITVLSSMFLAVVNILFYPFASIIYIEFLSLLLYFVLVTYFIITNLSKNKKTPLKFTSRVCRWTFLSYVLFAVLNFYLNAFIYNLTTYIRFISFAIMPITIPFIMVLSFIILLPFEKLNHKRYEFFAKWKLKDRTDLIKIGITGSYGKTSTKYILDCILSEKFNVCKSPASYNTPMGISIVVNNTLEDSHEVFIAEMGAYKKGEIKYLCNIVKPKYAILTSIGSQHLETFKSLENIKQTKYELIECLPSEGLGVFNGANEIVKELYEKTSSVNKVITGIDKNSFAVAEDIKITDRGTSFVLKIKEEEILCKTALLGEHNIHNILTASALSFKLGLTMEEIKRGIENIRPISHRLELTKTVRGITILDDSFNASVEGAKAALKVLESFEGRKIVITPGLVDLGEKMERENYLLGKQVAKVANICIIVNKVNAESIKKGLFENNFKLDSLYEADSLQRGQEILKDILQPNDILLIENDLPDNYF